ncbi:hypothetical protein XENTR_v10002184 [Xenopus tropicalis]|uniref:Uncharacterized protein LOC108644873 n=1 Tax=Xenopus tropicalis TaxID=8364 RepID=A0A8J1IRY7_XENTR|nr:uncharacterized protein LOC108644873 [Xenopus tropicalis]KAE8634045.1 hypothetical protein XENTR_v10002184 [Xenopus tropicalis]KAE8634046.1 hypothetical protein XENTR_v10002184 [Xenopus tropicalis]
MPCMKDIKEEAYDSNDTANKSQETRFHESEKECQNHNSVQQSKTHETSEAPAYPRKNLNENLPSSSALLVTTAEENIFEISEEVSSTRTSRASDPKNLKNILGDIDKCKQELANIKSSIIALESTLETICKNVCNVCEYFFSNAQV